MSSWYVGCAGDSLRHPDSSVVVMPVSNAPDLSVSYTSAVFHCPKLSVAQAIIRVTKPVGDTDAS